MAAQPQKDRKVPGKAEETVPGASFAERQSFADPVHKGGGASETTEGLRTQETASEQGARHGGPDQEEE